MVTPKFYTHYNRPPKVFTTLDYETCHVSQAEADLCSLSSQISRFGLDGLAEQMKQVQDKFGYADCRSSNSFSDIMNSYAKGVSYFESLPSSVRAQYNHRPEVFYEAIEKDYKMAHKHGFISDEAYSKLIEQNKANLSDLATSSISSEDSKTVQTLSSEINSQNVSAE